MTEHEPENDKAPARSRAVLTDFGDEAVETDDGGLPAATRQSVPPTAGGDDTADAGDQPTQQNEPVVDPEENAETVAHDHGVSATDVTQDAAADGDGGHDDGHGGGGDDGHDDASLAPEPDGTPAGVLMVVITLVMIFMAVSIIAVIPMVISQSSRVKLETDLTLPTPEKLAQQAAEKAILTSYADLGDGHYRVPIADAKAALVANPALMASVFAAPVVEVVVEEGQDPAEAALIAEGTAVAAKRICTTCHSVDGSRLVGPSWKGIWGTTRELADGTTVTLDDAYLKESILNPMVKVAKGYPPAMPPVPDISAEELAALAAYMKSLD